MGAALVVGNVVNDVDVGEDAAAVQELGATALNVSSVALPLQDSPL